METGLHPIYRDPSSVFPRGRPEGTLLGVGAGAALVERLPLRPSPHSFISPVMYPRVLRTLFPMAARELRIQEVLEMPVSTFISELSSMVSRSCPGTRGGQEAPTFWASHTEEWGAYQVASSDFHLIFSEIAKMYQRMCIGYMQILILCHFM